MPTPDPQQTAYIDIADFTPGIHSDEHATRFVVTPAGSPDMTGNLFGNGLARLAGTERCHADKTGALVPLPRAVAGNASGMRDFMVPHPSQFSDPDEPYRFLLDANIAPLLVDGTETETFPWTAVFNAVNRAPIHITWSSYIDGSFALAHWCVNTRSYHHWHHLLTGSLYDPATTALVDDTVWEDTVVGVVDGSFSIALPVADMCNTRFYYGFTPAAFGGTAFTVAVTDVFTGTQMFDNDEPVVLSDLTGATGVSAATTYWVRDSSGATFKLAASRGGAAIDVTLAGSGTITRVSDETFRPLWSYPVVVAMLATDWVRWGNGNRFNDAFATSMATILLASQLGLAVPPLEPSGSASIAGSNSLFSPAIGLKGQGTAIIGMSLQDNGRLDLPFNSVYPFRWSFHYSERGNVPQNDTIDDIAVGPINPFLLAPHQGRIVMADRRRTPPIVAETTGSTAAPNRGYQDDLLWFSDYHMPLQPNVTPALNPDKGVANSATLGFPAATHERYSTLLVAEDAMFQVGAMGAVTIDQFLVVKQNGGGAVIQGDLANPTVLRLPFIKSTGGVISHGAATPAGFVYGTDDGVYSFQGGETSVHLSPQLDGDFWNHDPTVTYSGARGRFATWEHYIACPNNFVYDLDTNSWWRFAVQTLDPVDDTPVPYNVYVTGNPSSRNRADALFAFPYKHRALPQSHVTFADAAAGSMLTIPDPFGALSELDVRFVIRLGASTAAATRTIVGQWNTTGDQRAWAVNMTSTGLLSFVSSTDGAAGTVVTATCDSNANWVGNPSQAGTYLLGRVTWRASDGRVQFFTKSPADIYGRIQQTGTSWRQMGADKLGVTSNLHNSTADLTVGNIPGGGQQLDDAELYAVWVESTIDGTSPVVAVYPQDFPDDPDDDATSFECESGQTVTVVRGAPELDFVYNDVSTTPPVLYQFVGEVLDNEYRWASHPLVETRSHDRMHSFQAIECYATYGGTVGSGDSNAYIDVTLRGFDEQGNPVASPTTSLRLSKRAEPQHLRADISPNFVAHHVTVEIHAYDDDDTLFSPTWAPKVHALRFATKPRARTIRHS